MSLMVVAVEAAGRVGWLSDNRGYEMPNLSGI